MYHALILYFMFSRKDSMNLSFVIITLNEANNIERCIRSVPFAEEVIVVDSGSTDPTADIAERCGAKVLYHEFLSFSSQKQWAIEQASGRWILSLDADEYLNDELADELESIVSSKSDKIGFRIPFRIMYMGKLMRFGPWSGEHHVRIFRNGYARFPDSGVHEGLEITGGSVGTLKKGYVVHNSFSSITDQMNKMVLYSRIWAEREFGNGRSSGFLQISLRPVWRFISAYLFRGGILEGIPGLASSLVSAFYVFMKWTMLYEMRHDR